MDPGEEIMEVGGVDYYLIEMRPNLKFGKQSFQEYLHTLGLKNAILGKNLKGDEKNGEAYNELIQFLDDKSLSLIMRGASDNEREALRILRDHYAGKGKPAIISLYTQLMSLKKGTE